MFCDIKDNYSFGKMSSCIRVLTADAIEKAGSGHPGMPLGMADIMTVLAVKHLCFNPEDPRWLGRDRLILSAGHGCMLLYAFYYLAGYKYFNLESLKSLRKFNSNTPAHPEYHPDSDLSPVEVTTGPLGQGLATSVGMAIAAKKYQNMLGQRMADYKIYTIVGDGCLMEGISYEAASLAGHLKLNNLIILFDDNKTTIDGKTSLTVSEDHMLKFSALGFNVEVVDGHNFDAIDQVLTKSRNSDKPCFIACQTIIGYGCQTKVGSAKSHGSVLGTLEVAKLKKNLNFDYEPFYIPHELLQQWRSIWLRNKDSYRQWHRNFKLLSDSNKKFLKEKCLNSDGILELKGQSASIKKQATRTSSSIVLDWLVTKNQKIIIGSADLSLSNGLNLKLLQAISKDDFSGNFIHYGVREHAMAAIMNGLALERFIAVGATFLAFSDYMRPSIRLSALMQLGVIYLLTHDSVGLGEDGPTHQPVEHLSALRCIPNVKVLRPADFIETVECWDIALDYAKQNSTSPVVISLSKQDVINFREKENIDTKVNNCKSGFYTFKRDERHIDVILLTSGGSEIEFAIKIKEALNFEKVHVRIMSVPYVQIFNDFKVKNYLSDSEKNDIINILESTALKVAIEAGSSYSWHRIIGFDGVYININDFGRSGPSDQVFDYCGFSVNKMFDKIMEKLSEKILFLK